MKSALQNSKLITDRPAVEAAMARARGVAFGSLLAVACVAPALADDTEIFTSQQVQGRPNILMIFDTSGSMNTDVPGPNSFDPSTNYTGACQQDRIYWRRDLDDDPTCLTVGDNWFEPEQLVCAVAAQGIAVNGRFQLTTGTGQWNPTTRRWMGLEPAVKDQPVECFADAGVHGETAADTRRYASNDTQWTAVSQQQFNYDQDGTDRYFIFYSGNWINWNSSSQAPTQRSRLQVVQDAARSLVQSLTGVNVGIMRYSSNGGAGDAEAEGGMVVHAVAPVESARTALITSINNLNTSGPTPLSETLFEAHQYFAGAEVIYGASSRTGGGTGGSAPSVPDSRVQPEGRLYKSPAETSCQKNYIIYLTDGLPNSDRNGEGRIETLLGRQCDGSGEGLCLDDLAEHMNTIDLRTSEGQQTVTTYTVGFGPEVQGSVLLAETARRGGGEMFAANNTATLVQTFDNIVEKIKQSGRTFAAPAVAVNSLNRLETDADLYVSLFEPGERFHWAGNLKKYQFFDGRISDVNRRAAVDSTGFFADGTRSIWSPSIDGGEVREGGAASRLPDPGQRKVYTLTGADNNLTAAENRVTAANTALQPLLGIGQAGDPSRQDLVNWALGADVLNADGDPTTTVRRAMGDPLHGRPAVVIYGDNDNAVVFAPTNDGYLHAVDAATGVELWSFIPPELLNRLPALFRDDPSATKRYGLDGDVRIARVDLRATSTAPRDDRILLFFGMGRGGSNYYALDVTSKTSPKHLWTLGTAQLPGVGQTWSPPALTRLTVGNATQNAGKYVLVLGGGYDSTQDNDSTTSLYNTDAVGNRIFMVDALSGATLWVGGGAGVRDDERSLSLPKMNNSIPSGVRVLDLDGNGTGDRMYAADTGGRVWRFDIFTDADASLPGVQVPTAASLVTGGVIASLGNADDQAHPISSTRRFYHTPDVAFIQRRGTESFLSISLGSGWRGHPLDERVQDRFYSIRDYQPFAQFRQSEFNSRVVLLDSDLTDITDIINGASVRVGEGKPGWRLELRLPGGFRGEKVLAESRTFNNVVLFPTYLPQSGAGGCGPIGRNRVYAVNVSDGQPIVDVNRDGRTDAVDRYTDLAQGGIAPEVSFYFLPRELQQGGGTGSGNSAGNNQRPALCSVGLEILPSLCREVNTVRTYWTQAP